MLFFPSLLAEVTNLLQLMLNDYQYTVLAPNDAAFTKLTKTQQTNLANLPGKTLRSLVLMHFVRGAPLNFQALQAQKQWTQFSVDGCNATAVAHKISAEGSDPVTIAAYGGPAAAIVDKDLHVSNNRRNGALVVQGINALMIPGPASSCAQFPFLLPPQKSGNGAAGSNMFSPLPPAGPAILPQVVGAATGRRTSNNAGGGRGGKGTTSATGSSAAGTNGARRTSRRAANPSSSPSSSAGSSRRTRRGA